LRKLGHFTQLHFALEEGMMGATKYPETVVHRRTHQQLIRQLNALAARHTRGGLALSPESLSFLDAWHADHVQQDDLHYGLWLNQAG
jgi:hemerythrin-like metal-binding protein